MTEEVAMIVKKLKSKECRDYIDIPYELRNNNEIINVQRSIGMRRYSNRGYDIISNMFFVVENIIDLNENSILTNVTTNFETFDEYYNYLNGEIYDNSCYYQYDFSFEEIDKYKININKINFTSLIDYTIEDDDLQNKLDCLEELYEATELKKERNQFWFKEALKCRNYQELQQLLAKFKKSDSYTYEFEKIMIYYLIQKKPATTFYILMEAINMHESILNEEAVCLYFSSEDVLNSINYNKNKMSKTTINRYMNKLKKFINNINTGNYKKDTKCEFDINTNYFFIEDSYIIPEVFKPIIIREYFYDINELINFLNGDLSNCNLYGSNIKSENIENCIVNDKTILPFNNNLLHITDKKYDNNLFIVKQQWLDKNDNIVLEIEKKFNYFFDFIYYLKNDLSNADLIFCDGLINLKSIKDIDFTNTHIKSEIMDKLGINYEHNNYLRKPISFSEAEKNEKETKLVLCKEKEAIYNSFQKDFKHYHSISYVSDIHLLHRLEKCKSKFDIEYTIRDIINNLLKESNRILLIGGDISSNFNLYKIFISELSNMLKNKYNWKKVIFILGNHELWDFCDKDLDDIISIYRNLIISNNMYFVHNNLLYIEDKEIKEISEKELNILSVNEIRKKIKRSSLIIGGGLAFSGYNLKFNANDGIYRDTITREQEIYETKKFDKIYSKYIESLYDKNVVILTHTPKKDWSNSNEYVKNWVYVSGHTHRNYFYDDGEYRIYSDNQLGYHYKTAFTKSFYIEYGYDCFADYEDGIYTISKEEYNDFYRGKNLMMDYNRDGNIYMLKKNSYYCFIKQAMNRNLSILNGGSLMSLKSNDINYYFENMDFQIMLNKEPLDKYTKYQKGISNCIKEIGGEGTIHGSIIDINFENHIYVNPFDGTLTGYYAYNIIDKYVYDNIPSLLKANCPLLFENYQKKLEISKHNVLIPKGQFIKINLKPKYYPNTDIYKSSREIKKMQRLNDGILTVWHNDNSKLTQIDKNKSLINK